ncbi:MAG: ABC transporter permease, partial [Bdellovibrionales bacterium]
MIPFFGLLFILGILWELASYLNWLSPSLFSSPSQILICLIENKDLFQKAFFETLTHSFYGFALSLCGGYPLA